MSKDRELAAVYWNNEAAPFQMNLSGYKMVNVPLSGWVLVLVMVNVPFCIVETGVVMQWEMDYGSGP